MGNACVEKGPLFFPRPCSACVSVFQCVLTSCDSPRHNSVLYVLEDPAIIFPHRNDTTHPVGLSVAPPQGNCYCLLAQGGFILAFISTSLKGNPRVCSMGPERSNDRNSHFSALGTSGVRLIRVTQTSPSPQAGGPATS